VCGCVEAHICPVNRPTGPIVDLAPRVDLRHYRPVSPRSFFA